MIKSIHITGRVQGVFFRASTQKKALQLNLTGFVQNQPDGSVYIEAKGSRHNLQQLIDWCHQGPRFARVQSVQTKNIRDFSQDPGNSFHIL